MSSTSPQLLQQDDTGRWRLDVRGYGCPHVQIYAEKALEKVTPGKDLTVVFDNPSSSESIFYFCRARGHRIVERDEQAGTFTWIIRRAG